MIYDAEAHETLTEREWDAAWAAESAAAILADAERALADAFWPPHPLDEDPGDPEPLDRPATVYLGTAGMVVALRLLGSTLDVASLAEAAARRYREHPDFGEAIPGLFLGESGVLLVASLLGGDHVERVRELAVANERNPAWELFWGSAGTLIAARELGLDEEYRRSATILVDEWRDGLWTQVFTGKARQVLGPAHGLAGNVHALRGFLDDDELRRRVAPVLTELAVRHDGLVNWPPSVGSDCTRVQWCHGAPGLVTTIGDLLPEDLLLGGAELTWHAGPLAKGAGLCHGTAGNGYAFLRTHALTGDEVWLERARRFAMHALEQVQNAPGRYTLYTGDVGAALFARACLDVDPRFPAMDVW